MQSIEDSIRGGIARSVKARLIRAGVTQSQIARDLARHKTQVGYVVNCRRRTAVIQEAIAIALGVKPKTVFGPFLHKSLRAA